MITTRVIATQATPGAVPPRRLPRDLRASTRDSARRPLTLSPRGLLPPAGCAGGRGGVRGVLRRGEMTKARAGRRAPAAAAPRERRAEEFDRASSEHTASRGVAPRRALTPTPQRKRQRSAGRRSSGGQTPQHAAAKEAPAAGDQAAAEEQGEASITAVTEVDNDAAQG